MPQCELYSYNNQEDLCERGVIQRNTLRRDVWDEMNRVERVHCASERLGRSKFRATRILTTQCEQGTQHSAREKVAQCE